MTPAYAPAPAPGYTLPGVEVPGGPTEEQATQAAVDYGWLIAIVLIGVALMAVVRSVTRQINFRLLGVIVVVGFIAYQFGKGGS